MKHRIEILVIVLLIIIAIALVSTSKELAGGSPPLNGVTRQPAAPDAGGGEGCLKCHAQIEPMHKFGPTQTLAKLDNGKDALGLTCTACHGGNPVATDKETAHVRPRFPRAWMRQ